MYLDLVLEARAGEVLRGREGRGAGGVGAIEDLE
jgi:hypothetical protein